MKHLTITSIAAALVLGSLAIAANAQTQLAGAASIHAQTQNATPIIKKAACNGRTGGMGCGPGWIWNDFPLRPVLMMTAANRSVRSERPPVGGLFISRPTFAGPNRRTGRGVINLRMKKQPGGSP